MSLDSKINGVFEQINIFYSNSYFCPSLPATRVMSEYFLLVYIFWSTSEDCSIVEKHTIFKIKCNNKNDLKFQICLWSDGKVVVNVNIDFDKHI